jgi:hypothetical protein
MMVSSPDSRWFHDRSERLTKVHAGALSEPTDHPPSLVSLESAIGIELMLEHLLAGNDMGTGRPIDKAPGPVPLQSLKLAGHGGVPVGIFQSSPGGGGYG